MWPSPHAAELAGALYRAVEACAPPGVALAVSGGRDSTLLLHVAARALEIHRERRTLRVLHVDHGRLQARHLWRRSVAAWSEDLGLQCTVLTLSGPQPRGESPEAWLRQERYRLLAAELGPGEVLLTAHHLDDQAETFLLQAIRGCGPAGLAGMPRKAALGPGWLIRPWLGVTREELRRVARELSVDGFDDPSNEDEAFDRNFLRQRVMPALGTRWSSVVRSLGRSARWQAECAEALEEAATALLPALVGEGGEGGTVISVLALLQYRPALRRVLLRGWLAACGARPPGLRHLEGIEHLLDARPDAQGEVCWNGMCVRRYRNGLHFERLPGELASLACGGELCWQPPDVLDLPEGRLTARLERWGAQRLAVTQAPCVVGRRLGGERIRPAGDRHTRSLKALFQRAGVPPWQRGQRPLLHRDGRLVAVPGLCVAEAAAAAEGESGWVLEWRSSATATAHR